MPFPGPPARSGAEPQFTRPGRTITYEPDRRPEVAGLVLLGALCHGSSPEEFADEIGARGAAALKAAVTEAVNERLRPLRARRTELARDPGVVRDLLRRGEARANALADATLDRVHEAMGMA